MKAAQKLSIYVEETEKFEGRPVYEVLMEIFRKRGIAGVSVFRGVAGYGEHRVFHTAKILELATSMPLKIEAVDSAEMIQAVLPEVCKVVGRGLVEVSDTLIVKSPAGSGEGE
ncbi:MAG: DUF190 domain-containing protein [Thermodesulfovibrionales bacterium]